LDFGCWLLVVRRKIKQIQMNFGLIVQNKKQMVVGFVLFYFKLFSILLFWLSWLMSWAFAITTKDFNQFMI